MPVEQKLIIIFNLRNYYYAQIQTNFRSVILNCTQCTRISNLKNFFEKEIKVLQTTSLFLPFSTPISHSVAQTPTSTDTIIKIQRSLHPAPYPKNLISEYDEPKVLWLNMGSRNV